ncbi:hypothetical protein ACFCX4_34145 [Kitasatospora sp. NPDC056327]|uniref:hypothetical protein n=1 Tax=Kitasatospora sp. NPDC056327 TaxID=3345785 RepID=UPI0035DF1972
MDHRRDLDRDPTEPPAPAWAELFRPPGPAPDLAQAWLDGLGLNPGSPADVLVALLGTGHDGPFFRLDIPEAVLDAAVVSPYQYVRERAAACGRLSPGQWQRLLTATESLPDHASARAGAAGAAEPSRPRTPGAVPPSTPEEIAALAGAVPEIDDTDRKPDLWWVTALHHDAAAMRQLASSPKAWIRRSVARAPRLPADVADRLARDESRVVRLFLGESCDDAPAGLLLALWEAGHSGTLSFPDRPRGHPNFPRDGLLRFADDPRPRLRRLALDDPAATPALVERLARDPDPGVRADAAQDPRLSPATAAALTNDPDTWVSHHARQHPALPPAVLAALLRDEDVDLAEVAAYNPGIPPAVMHRMITTAGAVLEAEGDA